MHFDYRGEDLRLLIYMEFFQYQIDAGDVMSNMKYHVKSVDELTFTDDGMFQAVMREPKICDAVTFSDRDWT